jgi:2,3-dihydroxybiphenyl 1,2-dioxygenase
MTENLELAYLGVEVADRAAFDTFLADVVGLIPGDPANDAASTWRNDDKVQRVIVHDGPANDAVYLGLEAADTESYAAAVERLRASGAEVVEGTETDRADRRVEDLVFTTAPWGVRVELVRGLADAATPFDSALVPGGFLTKGLGFGHVVFATNDLEGADRFITLGLGFAQTDWLEMDLGPMPMTVRFYHCNPRHHSLAIAGIPAELPTRLHHLMVETVSADNVGAAFDRAWNAEVPIANGLGKHDNDKMFSFYGVTPAGFQLEFGYGAVTVGDHWADNHRYDRISQWGHQPLSSPHHP